MKHLQPLVRLARLLTVPLLLTSVFEVPIAGQGTQTRLVRRVTKPLRPASLDFETGTITVGPSVKTKGLPSFNTSSSLSNLDHSGFVGVDSGPGGASGPCVWVTPAVKSTSQSSFVTAFAFAYCSAALSPASGGTGGRTRIGFRSGYSTPSVVGSAPTGTDAGTFQLSGLPAWTGCSSFFGGFNCFLMGVDIGPTPIVLPDGPISWSWEFRDLGTAGGLAKTFPFLSCIASCTPAPPPPVNGPLGVVDRYCPPNSFLTSFAFGTSTFGGNFTSVSMDIIEADAIAPSSSSLGAMNPRILAAGGVPRLGGPWSVTLDCGGADPAKLAIFRVAVANSLPKPAAAFASTKWGGLLVSLMPSRGVTLVVPHNGSTTTLGPFVVPLSMDVYGVTFATQGFCGDSPRGYLSNALVQTIGE